MLVVKPSVLGSWCFKHIYNENFPDSDIEKVRHFWAGKAQCVIFWLVMIEIGCCFCVPEDFPKGDILHGRF